MGKGFAPAEACRNLRAFMQLLKASPTIVDRETGSMLLDLCKQHNHYMAEAEVNVGGVNSDLTGLVLEISDSEDGAELTAGGEQLPEEPPEELAAGGTRTPEGPPEELAAAGAQQLEEPPEELAEGGQHPLEEPPEELATGGAQTPEEPLAAGGPQPPGPPVAMAQPPQSKVGPPAKFKGIPPPALPPSAQTLLMQARGQLPPPPRVKASAAVEEEPATKPAEEEHEAEAEEEQAESTTPPPKKKAKGPSKSKALATTPPVTAKKPPPMKGPPMKKAKSVAEEHSPAASSGGSAEAPSVGCGKAGNRNLVDPADWNIRYAEVLKLMPQEAWPDMAPHGEHGCTKKIVMGLRSHVVRIEVLVRAKSFRVAKPVMPTPTVNWGSDINNAWDTAKQKAMDFFVENKMEPPPAK
ncbi:unnamed protein product [Prorocentrum cordatum]|uniref:Uncharacterized protein n=1 Tax=Prorocentrum cordatum TaxID=2364126 RepID=A0ABN9UZ70_9DINO|nr:unnamed protein product [Polarella glacialis]